MTTLTEWAAKLLGPKRAKYAKPVAIGAVIAAALLFLWLVAVLV